MPVPDKFLEIEEIFEPWMQFYLNAFYELSTDRAASLDGVSPIPAWSIRAYAQDVRYAKQDFQDFRAVIRIMDAHYLKNKSKKSGQRSGEIRKANASIGKARRGKR